MFRAFTGADDVESVGPRPFDEFTNQSRLVAIGKRVDEAGGFRPLRQYGSREDVRFDVDHDKVGGLRRWL